MTLHAPRISVVVPVYKAEGCLDELYTRLCRALETVDPAFEIILVEDCGGDRSWEVIQRLAVADSRVRGIQFSRNFGQHHGITAGLDYCRGDWTVVMDCDLQDRPEEIPRLYAKAMEGYDVVLANRGERADSLLKTTTSRLFYKIFNYLADIEYDGDSGNFCIISRRVVKHFCEMREQLRFFGGLIAWMGFPTARVDVTHAARHDGKSSYSFTALWKLASQTIVAHSDKPLRIAIQIGFAMAALAFCYGAYIFTTAFVNRSPIPGWSSLIVSLYFIGGLIIAFLGVLGVYLGRTFDETKRRPLYIVRHATFDEPACIH
jgi:dolichol-phosphate mannosyltransferase